jgi:thioester reductase-like protein
MGLLVSGATGFLGDSLLEQAEVPVTVLLRGRDWERRAAKLRRRHGHVDAVPGDVKQPAWGLDADSTSRLAERVDVVVNLAAETSWSAAWPRLEGTNVDGPAHAAEVAARLDAWLLHVSSLYVGYEQSDEVPAALFEEHARLSRYERSKCRGEWAAVDRCQALDVPLRVVRVGTLVGDRQPPGGRRSAAAQVPFLRTFSYLPKMGWKVVPYVEGARLDTMPRDVTARAVLDGTMSAPSQPVEIDHVSLGHQAPMVSWILSEIAARLRRAEEPAFHPLRVPPAVLRFVSDYGDRFGTGPRASAWIGVRYLAGRSVYLSDRPYDHEVTLGSLRTALGLESPRSDPHEFYTGWMT